MSKRFVKNDIVYLGKLYMIENNIVIIIL